MLVSLLLIYGSVLLGAFLPTVFLILAGKSWGQLPFLYLRIVGYLQSLFPPVYPRSKQHWPAVIDRDEDVCLKRNAETSSASFSFLKGKHKMLEMGIDFMQNGLESIVQDELSSAFDRAPTYDESLLRMTPPRWWTLFQRVAFYFSAAFRLLLLFPVRLALFFSSFVFISLACITSFLTQKTWIAIVYCRLYNAGLGVVAAYKDLENVPRKPGIAVANHLTPNDIQIIWAGTPHGRQYGFMVTGQKHRGIIGVIETLVSRLCPSLWLERKCAKERSDFLTAILGTAKEGGPVLLFPEGYCTNNSQVLQFRRAVFEADLDIYPVSIRQQANFGDSFWYEDQFHIYLLRLMLSWAVVYEVKYLPSQRRHPLESNGQFAARVQALIADAVDIRQGQFDGGYWYKKTDQKRILEEQQLLVAACLVHEIPFSVQDTGSESSLSDDGFCMCEVPPEEDDE